MIEYKEGRWIQPCPSLVVEHNRLSAELNKQRVVVERETSDRVRAAEISLHSAIKAALLVTSQRLARGEVHPSAGETAMYLKIQMEAEHAVKVEAEASKLLGEAWRLIMEHNKKRPVAVFEPA